MIARLAVSGHRSIRELVLAPGRLMIVAGANGAGKSSLYRAPKLLADVAPAALDGLQRAGGGLHPGLVAPLARLMRDVAGETQLIVVSHSAKLAEALGADERCV